MDWKLIPSLTALRAFEATCRLGSQSLAAAELNVTQAAIAQHIRALEERLSTSLFARQGRNLVPSDAGERLFAAVHEGFESIERGVREIAEPQGANRLRISTPPSFYERWLVPRLPKFWEQFPEIHLHVEASIHVVDLLRDDFDATIRYGRGYWPPYESDLIWQSEVSIFASKLYLQTHPEIHQSLVNADWIIAEDSPEIKAAIEAHGYPLSQLKTRQFQKSSEARAAMIAGLGVLAQHNALINTEIEYGIVEPIFPLEIPPEFGHYLVKPKGRNRQSLRLFENWLRREIAAENIKNKERTSNE